MADCMANKTSRNVLELFLDKSGRTRILTILMILIGVVGVRTQSSRDLEIEELLTKLNKPAIKTIQSPNGDIIDCVDINKQPAFDHPLLKNHTIEMRPSFSPKMAETGNYSVEFSQKIWLQSGSCPEGTIPIRRVRKNDLLRVESLESFGMVHPHPYVPTGIVEPAGMTMLSPPRVFFNGVMGDLSVWKPFVERAEYSSSAISIGYGLNFIHAGWVVNSAIFRDNEPRIFVSWEIVEGNNRRGCVNMLCPGFVQVNRAIVLGAPLRASRFGGPVSMIRFQLYKNDAQRRWWVKINNVDVGYWPFELFPNFNKGMVIDWGGRVYNTRNFGHHAITQMGSGRFAQEGFGKAAHIENMIYLNERNTAMPPQNLQFKVMHPRCYNVVHPHAAVHTMFFGGPGGEHCDRA